jgi:RNA polymerase subunit RPABC4/transcription elongation factor Spt4
MVESGRYQNIPREERICQICTSNEVETEHHFLTLVMRTKMQIANDTNQPEQDLSVDHLIR